ncbi:MAG: hypothetical protein QM765_08465 [Myxococcales bacterium]
MADSVPSSRALKRRNSTARTSTAATARGTQVVEAPSSSTQPQAAALAASRQPTPTAARRPRARPGSAAAASTAKPPIDTITPKPPSARASTTRPGFTARKNHPTAKTNSPAGAAANATRKRLSWPG